MVQNLSRRIVFQEKVEFLKSGIWFQFTLHQTKIHLFDSSGIRINIAINRHLTACYVFRVFCSPRST